MAAAHVNPAYAMNEAYTSNEKDNEMAMAEKIATSQDVKLTENFY